MMRPPMTKKVFINYRRADSQWATDAVYKALRTKLPPDHVFMDVDSIPIGVDFVEYLDGWVRRCDVLLVMIGPQWLDAIDPHTRRRRLDNENDFVRIEIRQALRRKIPVVPVLLDGTSMPDAAALPEDIRALTRRNGVFLHLRTYETDLNRLIQQLQLAGPASPEPTPGRAFPAFFRRGTDDRPGRLRRLRGRGHSRFERRLSHAVHRARHVLDGLAGQRERAI